METVISPKKGILGLDLKELWRYRELFFLLALRDIKVRYKQTVLGISWAILQPFVTMVVFSVVFGKLANMPSENIPYPVFSYAGLLLWTIFASSLNHASSSLVANMNIIQKVYLPRLVIPASSVIVSFVDFFFASLVFVGILVYYGFMPNFLGLMLLPFLLLIILFSSLGAGFFLAAVNAKYRDVRHALPFFIQLLVFLTPVIYPSSIVPEAYRWLLYLNPMTGVIEGFRAGFLGTSAINWQGLAASAITALGFMIFGIWYFLKNEKEFADII